MNKAFKKRFLKYFIGLNIVVIAAMFYYKMDFSAIEMFIVGGLTTMAARSFSLEPKPKNTKSDNKEQ